MFAVVRHPSARLWSAWQSKFLLRELRWVEEFAGAPWLPRVPRSTHDVDEDFGRFAQEWDGTLERRESSEMPLAPLGSLFPTALTKATISVYGADVEAFGYADVVPSTTEPAGEYPRALVVAVARLAERGERLGDLAVRANVRADKNRALRRDNRALRSQRKSPRSHNKALRGEQEALGGRRGSRSLVWRLRRKLAVRG